MTTHSRLTDKEIAQKVIRRLSRYLHSVGAGIFPAVNKLIEEESDVELSSGRKERIYNKIYYKLSNLTIK